MDVTNAEQASIAEEAGAAAVMALERIPADIRAHGGVARMSDPKLIKGIQDAVSIPVMAKCRIGEGAALIRTKGEAGSGNIVEAVRHMRKVQGEIRRLTTLGEEELMAAAKNLGAPYEIVRQVAKIGKLPVPNFAAGGVATPADAALMMQLGAESVFVGSGIFKSSDPKPRAEAVVLAVTHYNEPEELARISEGLGEPMVGINISDIPEPERMAERGW